MWLVEFRGMTLAMKQNIAAYPIDVSRLGTEIELPSSAREPD
jgi:hypothetical protein